MLALVLYHSMGDCRVCRRLLLGKTRLCEKNLYFVRKALSGGNLVFAVLLQENPMFWEKPVLSLMLIEVGR